MPVTPRAYDRPSWGSGWSGCATAGPRRRRCGPSSPQVKGDDPLAPGHGRRALQPRRRRRPPAPRLRRARTGLRTRHRARRGHVPHALPPGRAPRRARPRRRRSPAGLDAGDRGGAPRTLADAPGLFAPVAEHPSTETALVAAYRELREASSSSLDAIAARSERAADVVRLHRAARAQLEADWYDEQDLMAAAADAAGSPATSGRSSSTSPSGSHPTPSAPCRHRGARAAHRRRRHHR